MLTLAVVAIMQAMYASSGNTVYGWSNMVVSDAMGNWLKCFATLSMMVALVYARPYSADRGMLRGGELFSLAIFSLLGIFIMIGSNHLLVLYLGLELLTLSSYAMVALRRDHEASVEAAMKYFVLGAMASGFLLYGAVHDLRRHRHAGHRRNLRGHRCGRNQAADPGVRPGVPGGRSGLQAGRRALPHVGFPTSTTAPRPRSP